MDEMFKQEREGEGEGIQKFFVIWVDDMND